MDATIIAAPPSSKNRSGQRDPDMHQTKKGQQWYFGMKAHIGADDAHGLVHTVEGTAANVSDISQAHALLHGEEKRAGADAGYTGIEKRPEIIALNREIDWRIAAKRSTLAKEPESFGKALWQAWEKAKARVHALVEPPFHIVKNLFGYRKVRSRGLVKNSSQQRARFALANLYKMRRHLLPAAA